MKRDITGPDKRGEIWTATQMKSYRSYYNISDLNLLELVVFGFELAEQFPSLTETELVARVHVKLDQMGIK